MADAGVAPHNVAAAINAVGRHAAEGGVNFRPASEGTNRQLQKECDAIMLALEKEFMQKVTHAMIAAWYGCTSVVCSFPPNAGCEFESRYSTAS